VDLGDRLEIERVESPGVQLSVEGSDCLPLDRDNLVIRAAELFMGRSGRTAGVRFKLQKNIPIGAGLGGGSSNAAMTLLGLNTLFGSPFGHDDLCEMGSLIGSDVVFFLTGGTAVGQGRGERIQTLDDVPLPESFLLVWPGFSVSTREAYSLLQAPPLEDYAKLTGEQVDTKIRPFLEIMKGRRWMALRNDLEGPVLARFPALSDLKGTLSRSGCPGVLLAGSGSTMMGMGPRSILTRIAQECVREKVGSTFLCRGVGRTEYRNRLGLNSGSGSGLR
jgi:4-diphosphocytidyl-2-C-methyl-D-erythritol kinase